MSDKISENIPLVSICCTCYNHELFVRETLEGFLMQETTFSFEIVVFDDASTDNTQQVILEYANKYPHLFRLFLQKENLWQRKGISGTQTLSVPNARGKYIAFCEGDDYWTDPFKLQKQVDFLEANPDYGLVHADYQYYFNSANRFEYVKRNNLHTGNIFEYLLRENEIVTLTVLARAEIIKEFMIFWKLSFSMIDYPMWLYLTEKHKVHYIPQIMGVYRKLTESMSNTWDIDKRRSIDREVLDIRVFFAQRNNLMPLIEKQLVDFEKEGIVHAFYTKDRELSESSYRYLHTKSNLSIKDRLLYAGSRSAILRPFVRIIMFVLKNK